MSFYVRGIIHTDECLAILCVSQPYPEHLCVAIHEYPKSNCNRIIPFNILNQQLTNFFFSFVVVVRISVKIKVTTRCKGKHNKTLHFVSLFYFSLLGQCSFISYGRVMPWLSKILTLSCINKHLSNSIPTFQISIEPITGNVWGKSVKVQQNVGILPEYIEAGRLDTVMINATNVPLPVYWLDQSFQYNSLGVDDHQSRVSTQCINTAEPLLSEPVGGGGACVQFG